MKFITIIKGLGLFAISSSIVLAATLPAGVSVQHRSLDGHALEPLNYEGEINGRAVEFEGTVEEMMAQPKERYDIIPMPVVHDSASLAGRGAAGLPTQLLCIPVPGQSWDYADYVAILDGIKYIYGLDTNLNLNGHTCSRISCSYNSGIYFCNDNGYRISVYSDHIGDLAQTLNSQCHIWLPGGAALTGGQVFDSDGYNIIIHDDNC